MKEAGHKCLDSQLWHSCAGGMVQMPAVEAKVYYFPQGHAEHAQGLVDFGTSLRIPPLILCRVTAVRFMADPETDEVFAKIHLIPLQPDEPDYDEEENLGLGINGAEAPEKPASFAKTLTQSDANNGGGFSVPRFCAETIFPGLDYSADPPVQTVLAKDVHGEIWKFRHIYRGTPRRHLLTTGWSNFVNQKRLVAGDSIVFLRTENGDLCMGIRRARRGGIGGGPDGQSGWHAPSRGNMSVSLQEDDHQLMRGTNLSSAGSTRGKARAVVDSVVEAAARAASGRPFVVVYYPRASTPEFCVKAASVRAAMRIQWCPGMRFKMPFETEDSSRISWFMGTVSSVQTADPIRWPGSLWRLLQVTWDEPDLLQNVKRVSPWLVELVSNMPAIHLAPYSPPRKKPRVPQHPDFPLDGQLPIPLFPGNPVEPSRRPFCCFQYGAPARIQGARHAQFGTSLSSDLRLNKLQSSLFPAAFHCLDHNSPLPRLSTGLVVRNPIVHDNVSCRPTTGNSSLSAKKPGNEKQSQLMLFGQPLLTEQQLSSSNSGLMVSIGAQGSSFSEGVAKTAIVSDGSGRPVNQKGLQRCKDRLASEFGLETGHCKVFMESEDVGRTLDLSVFGSYEELYTRLAEMFGIKKSEITSHLLYRDASGSVKQTGDEPFSDFMKKARRLTILTDPGNDDLRRSKLTTETNKSREIDEHDRRCLDHSTRTYNAAVDSQNLLTAKRIRFHMVADLYCCEVGREATQMVSILMLFVRNSFSVK